MHFINPKNIIVDKLSSNLRANDDLTALKKSIINIGVKNPIIIYRSKGTKNKFVLIDGYRRMKVYKELGYKFVICKLVKI